MPETRSPHSPGRPRLFVAVCPPLAALREAAARLPLGQGPAEHGIHWLDPARWHITLRFLGPWPVARVSELQDACSRCASEAPARILLRLERLGAFPTAAAARVIWVGVAEPTGALGRLATALESEVVGLGATPASRPFHPHLTVARLQRPRDIRSFTASRWPPIEATIDRLVLYESLTLPGGARYLVRDDWAFGGSGR